MSGLSPEFETLTQSALDLARPMLARFQGFYPYGLAITLGGELVEVPVCDDADDQPSAPLIEALRLTMRAAAVQDRYAASVVVYDATLSVRETGRDFDVVAMELDDRHGRSIVSYVPYSVPTSTEAQCSFGEAIIDPGEHEIFGSGAEGWEVD